MGHRSLLTSMIAVVASEGESIQCTLFLRLKKESMRMNKSLWVVRKDD